MRWNVAGLLGDVNCPGGLVLAILGEPAGNLRLGSAESAAPFLCHGRTAPDEVLGWV
jgi:hypothetical protein